MVVGLKLFEQPLKFYIPPALTLQLSTATDFIKVAIQIKF
ncbi:hypothetical protein BH11BAC4_BH11BAC4_01810 [soil metagenome]